MRVLVVLIASFIALASAVQTEDFVTQNIATEVDTNPAYMVVIDDCESYLLHCPFYYGRLADCQAGPARQQRGRCSRPTDAFFRDVIKCDDFLATVPDGCETPDPFCPPMKCNDYVGNVWVFEDFSAPSSDVEGSLFAQGNVSLIGYSVGEKLDGFEGPAIVAGGSVFWHTGKLYHGNIIYGTDARIGTPILNGLMSNQVVMQYPDQPELLTQFQACNEYFIQLYTHLAGLGGVYSKGSYLSGPVHEITCETLSKLHTLDIHSDSTVVVNVHGEECYLSNIGITSSVGCENTIFNFNALTLHISEVTVPGCVVAPYAEAIGSSGVIFGQSVFRSFTGTTQFNNCVCDAVCIT